MEWVGRFNQAMEYIEEHITEETDYEALGRIVCCSAYQLQQWICRGDEGSLTLP